MTQQILPAIHVEARGEEARRLLACVKACTGIPTDALEEGILGRFLASIVAMHEDPDGPGIDFESEEWLLERLGFLGGAAADCCARSKLSSGEGKG
jgi:hypothetical protein